jgi:hypothetical protein
MERRTLYGGGLLAAGVLLAGAQLSQGIQQLGGFEGTDRVLVFTFETAPFLLISAALAFVGYWLTTRDQYEPELPRILAWGVGSTLLFASVAALLLFSQEVTQNTLEQGPYIAMNQITVGAVVGVLVGIYDARSRLRQRELERERDRVEAFAQKAADVNNYGREVNRSSSLDEVSSLCIESLQAFLGLSEIAVVVTDGEESQFVDNTVVGTQRDVVADLAIDALGQEQATVVVRESTPVGDEKGDVISILVTGHDESSVVLLAFTGGRTEFAQEDIQLLEMLVSHAATAIDRIHDRRVSAPEGPSTTD